MVEHSSPENEQATNDLIAKLMEERDDALAKGAALFYMIPEEVAAEIKLGDVQEKWKQLLRASAQSTLIPAGKQARFKNEKSWFPVFDWHNNPESFEYRTVYTTERRDLCAGGINPGWDECEKCGATADDECAFTTLARPDRN